MNPLRRWLIVGLAALALAFGLLWWNTRDTKAAGADAAHIAALDRAIAAFATQEHRVDTVYLQQKTVYVAAGRSADVAHAAADADTANAAKQRAALAAETTARKACGAALTTAEQLVALCRARADSLQAKVTILEHPHRPRVVPFAEPLYDLGTRTFVGQAGVDYRLFADRLAARALVQQRLEPHATPSFLVGAHLTF